MLMKAKRSAGRSPVHCRDRSLAPKFLAAARRREAAVGVDVTQGGGQSHPHKRAPRVPVMVPVRARRAPRPSDVAARGAARAPGGWASDEDDARCRWAFVEARRMLQRYSGVRKELEEVMSAGCSAGDCVNLIEDRLKSTYAPV